MSDRDTRNSPLTEPRDVCLDPEVCNWPNGRCVEPSRCQAPRSDRTKQSSPDPNATLGSTLHRARRHQGHTLRAVERATGIPNAHLSQIESGKIGRPGAELIWKLAGFYRLDFALLALMAGHEWAAALAEDAAITREARRGS